MLGKQSISCFDSKLVRLKVLSPCEGGRVADIRFDSKLVRLKVDARSIPQRTLYRFDSKLVRLKE